MLPGRSRRLLRGLAIVVLALGGYLLAIAVNEYANGAWERRHPPPPAKTARDDYAINPYFTDVFGMANLAVGLPMVARGVGLLWLSRSRAGANPSQKTGLQAGALFSVYVDGKYRVAKVLVVEPDAVHVRLYKETYARRPEQVPSQTLTLGTIHDVEGFGMGYLPLSEGAFRAWRPEVLGFEPVTDDELDGYKIWREDSGGVFG